MRELWLAADPRGRAYRHGRAPRGAPPAGDAERPLHPHPDSSDVMSALFGGMQRHPAAMTDVRESFQEVIRRREVRWSRKNGQDVKVYTRP